jgi:phosphoribosylglycinamide formyltransferase-1
MINLGIIASGRGSNMQAVINACRTGTLQAVPRVVISNNSQSGALGRAKQIGMAHYHLSSVTHPDPAQLDATIREALLRHHIDLVVLAGYMKKLGPQTLTQFRRRVLNIHPALLPKFGGRGMYGLKVHEAVIAAGESETGVTIHLVEAEYDTGPIIDQCHVPVLTDDTPQTLSQRVLACEHRFLVETLVKIINGEIDLTAL